MCPAAAAARGAALAAAALLAAHAVLIGADTTRLTYGDRSLRLSGAGGCRVEGRRVAEGALVAAHDACLRCACGGGALSCRRRACAALPDPPPRRCHVLHRKGACCPELHCPDGVQLMELGASARAENDDYSDIAPSSSFGHAVPAVPAVPACVEGGAVYAAGSALGSATACEQCFCLGGERRCVRPRCLPPPPGCRARPAPGACCPQRYYCDRTASPPAPHTHNTHDCSVEEQWFSEGERVPVAERGGNCTQCFCLRGRVRCQPLQCAPPLLGCTPLLRPGQCCPHQYRCQHTDAKLYKPILHNSLISIRNDDRSLRTTLASKHETSTRSISTSSDTKKNYPTSKATRKVPVTTAKVKRKTNETPSTSTSSQPETSATDAKTAPDATTLTAAIVSTTEKLLRSNLVPPTTEAAINNTSTEHPDGIVKIMINGTINCTAELSSTSLPLNLTVNDTERIKLEAIPRIPTIKLEDMESQTFNPSDIITDSTVNGNFDEDETFTINVTSSLSTNSSQPNMRPSIPTVSKTPTILPAFMNISTKTNEFELDYAEPTLPPSLPNLKIIPFVAADAVVDGDESPKEVETYPILEREDKYPVYFPGKETKVTPVASRREDLYHPTQYPVFTSEKLELLQYPALTHEMDTLELDPYPSANNDLLNEHLLTSIGSHLPDINEAVTKLPSTSTSFKVETPSVNLFSPPIETEGGFIPKGPGIIDEYYAVYPSTPSGPSVPHLTTSMQLGSVKECISSDGRRVLDGDAISVACSVCSCAWGEMHCSPRPCHAPSGCYRRPASSSTIDLCCGELFCDQDKVNTTSPTTTSTETIMSFTNESFGQDQNKSIEYVLSTTDGTLDTKNSSITSGSDVINESYVTEIVTGYDNFAKNNSENSTTSTTTAIPTTINATTKNSTMSLSTTIPTLNNESSAAQDYEEEEEDEGFSFGSVLKLLLSDSYDTTTASYKRKSTLFTKPVPTRSTTTSPPPSTTKRPVPKPPVAPFVPMPHHYPYMPPKKTFQQNTVNRIDHLVLGEATAIKKSTPRPTIGPFKPVTVTFKPVQATTQRPFFTTRTPTTVKEGSSEQPSTEEPRPGVNVLPAGGLLKLAGCNIYGRMYRVGRIIAELSTPCRECRCTELGVQCRTLSC